MFNYIKFDLFLMSSLEKNVGWGDTKTKPETLDLSHLSPEQKEQVEELQKQESQIKWSLKFLSQYMNWLTVWLDKLSKTENPNAREFQEFETRIKARLSTLWLEYQVFSWKQTDVKSQLDKITWIQRDIRTQIESFENKSWVDINSQTWEVKKMSLGKDKLKTIDNKEFLSVPANERLQYITKDNIDTDRVSSWEIKDVEFTFTFDGQFNRELYLKTTAGQVLPKEVWQVQSWGEVYERKNIWWEFFTPDNKRLIIQEWTKVEFWNLRNLEDLEKLSQNNQNQIKDYLDKNPQANKDIVSEAINRWIDPKFACIAFTDLVKDLSSEETKVVLEDAFTEFDRYRWGFNLSNEIIDGKYSDKLAMWLFTQFSKDWKQSAKDYWISEERIKASETNGELYFSMDAKAIQNADSLPDWTYLRWDKLLENPEFSAKLDKVCASLWANREDLIKVMRAESRLDPRVVNGQSKATGLIQFMPKTAEWLWTSVWNIRAMTWVEQLDLVEKYFKQNSRWYQLSTIEDLYKVVFFPAALWKPNDWVFDAKDAPAHKVAAQNWVISKHSTRSDGLIDWYAFSKYVNNHVSRLA